MEVKHKTHTITYREASNDWWADAIGVAPSLVAAKKSLDEIDRKGRRADIPALWLEEDIWSTNRPAWLREVKIGTLAEPRYKSDPHEAFISYPRKGGGFERSKVSMSALYPLEAREQLEEYIRLKQAERAAEKAAEKFKEGLKTLDHKTIMAAKEAAGKEGGK